MALDSIVQLLDGDSVSSDSIIEQSDFNPDYYRRRYVPLERILTINGVSYDLSVDRTWVVSSSFADQAANLVYAGPVSGAVATPAFRALVSDDIPSIGASKITSGTLPVTRGGTGTSTQFTQNSVIFAGASGVYTQDNTNLYYNDTDNWLHANKLMLNTAYTGDPYSFVHKAVDSVYEFKFLDSSGNVVISSQSGNLFLRESSSIRSTGSSLTFGLSVYDGVSLSYNSLGTANGILTGNSTFIKYNPVIRSESSDTQLCILIDHEIEQSSTSTGKITSFSSVMDQVINLTRSFNTVIGSNVLTITDARGVSGLTNGDIITGVGIPAATTIVSIAGNDLTISNSATTTVTGGLLTDMNVTYSASDIADFRSFESIIGASSTQSAFYAEDASSNVLFRVGGDGSFTFKGGTYAPAQTGWSDSSTNYIALRDLAFDLSTVTASDANFRLLARAFITLEFALRDKGIILS